MCSEASGPADKLRLRPQSPLLWLCSSWISFPNPPTKTTCDRTVKSICHDPESRQGTTMESTKIVLTSYGTISRCQ